MRLETVLARMERVSKLEYARFRHHDTQLPGFGADIPGHDGHDALT